ncbi:MAG: hypothetical protein V3V08_00055 [Nannocystaceae bacterium]
MSATLASLIAAWAAGVGLPDGHGPPDLVATTPRCKANLKYCFGLAVHVVPETGRSMDWSAWLRAQVKTANQHFAAIEVGFEVTGVEPLSATYAHTLSRSQRDEIGRGHTHVGSVPLFLVARLGDVDHPGRQIRGVHWRRRQKVSERWLIMSEIAQPTVLAHELGHFFDLPHSTHSISIMNKRERKLPPRSTRTFAPAEVEQMIRARDRMLSTTPPQRRAHLRNLRARR